MIRKVSAYFIAYAAKILIRVIMATCKITLEGADVFQKTASDSRCILMLWHNRLSIAAHILFKYLPKHTFTAFISKSQDADPLAILAESYHRGHAIRVPHNARHQALNKAIQRIKLGEILVFTPDGPKGPINVVKRGIGLAARGADALIIPFTWTAENYWEFNTWDKMRLPKPFTNIHVHFGLPLPSTSSVEDLQAALDPSRGLGSN